MKLQQYELGIVALLIGYIAFFTHPPPEHIQNFLQSPVGKIVALLGVLYVLVYCSLIVGLFLGIAFVSSVKVTEYLDPAQQKPTPISAKSAAGVPAPQVKDALAGLMKGKGMKLPQVAGKSVKTKPKDLTQPKPAAPPAVEKFCSFE